MKISNFQFPISKPKAGFSLMELLVYISILAIVATLIAQIFISLNQGRARVEARTELNDNLRFALEKIRQDLIASSTVSLPATAGASSEMLSLVTGDDQVVYCLAADQLRRQVGGACDEASAALTSDKVAVYRLAFSRVENQNAVLSKKSVSIGIELGLRVKNASPEWQADQVEKTFITLPQSF